MASGLDMLESSYFLIIQAYFKDIRAIEPMP